LARSRAPGIGTKRRFRYLAFGIPLLALAIVTGVYVVYLLPVPSRPAVMDYTFQLLLEQSNRNGSQVRAIAPKVAIGEPGGFWNSLQYNSYGVDSSHYPLYLDTPSAATCPSYCIVHVKSAVAHNYTLGDYFQVWGQPLGADNTIGIPRNGDLYWQMCIGLGSGASNNSEWGAFVLKPNLDITLFYHNSTGLGCSPS
jgi:hypothetical protein